MAPGPERRSASSPDRAEPYSEKDKEAAKGVAAPHAADALPPPPAAAAAAEVLPAPPAAAPPADDAALQQAAFKAAIAAATAAAAQAAAIAQARAAAGPPRTGAGLAPMPPQEPGGPTFVKVSANSQVKQVAGKVAHTCRAGDAPAMLAIGSSCINQGVKAIATARGYLANDGHDLTFQTAFREGGTPEKPSVAMYMAKHPLNWAITPNNVEMQVGPASGVQVVSTALAQRIREGIVPCLTGVGMDAVSNCVLAIGHTRLALEPDGLDIRARPEFIHVQAGGELNALKFHIHVDRI
ncbi:hypothetical protein MNEG_4239 [Monoraphidium neglectum]|uniref:Uncharacterized protein n=1 Tax=Monoraphidium neglectum TaxID=145388 RepID=A0A0D2NEY7_9CHLO|nr:hypothetical protein MNEG_4239 [Monoraphidium neglectum]KIZ03721.1 hypothetical protein MNEG_4239 [Monoraphidium neglectum]|eukprot:XP_013902740.1 hypothetical protein MNEG_4239 [Monoraphidium neglectum]